MIVYKVVERQTRHCSNWTIFKKSFLDTSFYTQTLKFKRKNPEWFPRYFKGKLVKAAPGSVGIFCFATKKDAEQFQSSYRALKFNGILIKVRGLGRSLTENHVRLTAGCGNTSIINIREGIGLARPAPGTLCFKSVRVLT